MLTLLADRTCFNDTLDEALEHAPEEARGASPADLILSTWAAFPDSLMIYSQTAMSVRAKVDAATAPTLPAAREPRPGRNDACNCGSGRKFKKCCGKLQVVWPGASSPHSGTTPRP